MERRKYLRSSPLSRISPKAPAVLLILGILLCFCSCRPNNMPVDTTAAPSTSVTETAQTEAPHHSPLYMEDLSVDLVLQYFNVVCLDAEFVNSGDATLLQKWSAPIYYLCSGTPTEEDLKVLENFTQWLNTLDGFPGIYPVQDPADANLQIHFCSQAEMLGILGDEFSMMDGGVTFWYEENVIYKGVICCRTDLDQTLRNSVILEELYNCLGPIQDTQLRSDSIIYSEFSQPQQLSAVDELLLRLLYHPTLQCGMDDDTCEVMIRQLYY